MKTYIIKKEDLDINNFYIWKQSLENFNWNIEAEKNLWTVKFKKSLVAKWYILFLSCSWIESNWLIKSGEWIKSDWGIKASKWIETDWEIEARYSIISGEWIKAGDSIISGEWIKAGDSIISGWCIISGWWIISDWWIETREWIIASLHIDCKWVLKFKHKLFAWICIYPCKLEDYKTITCWKKEWDWIIAYWILKETWI